MEFALPCRNGTNRNSTVVKSKRPGQQNHIYDAETHWREDTHLLFMLGLINMVLQIDYRDVEPSAPIFFLSKMVQRVCLNKLMPLHYKL